MNNKLHLFVAFGLGVAIIPSLMALGVCFGGFSVPATDKPSRWEERLATHALSTALANSARNLQSPVPDNEDTLLAGLKLYRGDCAGCHGDFRAPSSWGSNNFYPRVPQFSTTPPSLSAAQMYVVIKNGIRYSGMGAWNGEISEKDMWRVALFLSHLARLPPSVDAAWRNPAG